MRRWFRVVVTGWGKTVVKTGSYEKALEAARMAERECWCKPDANAVVIEECEEHDKGFGFGCRSIPFAWCNPDPEERELFCDKR